MKQLFVALSLMMTTAMTSSATTDRSPITDSIERHMRFEPGTLPIAYAEKGLVRVSFKVDAAGHITILETNYSNEQLNRLVVDKLTALRLEGERDTNSVHYVRFTFEKL